jgi:cellulase (glycosyl hydrolase family 5)
MQAQSEGVTTVAVTPTNTTAAGVLTNTETGVSSNVTIIVEPIAPDPPTNTVSPDGSKMPPLTTLNSITTATDATLIAWTLAGGVLSKDGKPDTTTSGVALGEIVNKGQMRQTNAAGNSWDYTPDKGYPWTAVGTAPQPPSGGLITVSLAGFKDGNGQVWRARGLNSKVSEAPTAFGNVFRQYPGMSCLRINVGDNPSRQMESDAAIDAVVKQYNGAGCVILLEDHSGNTKRTDWYARIAGIYKNNNMVLLGTANEPGGDVQNDQIAIINAIKGAGWKGLIGLQCGGGYKYDYINGVIAACGKDQLFLTPHIYYNGNDPNGGQAYLDSDISQAAQRGLFCMFTEFGDAMDGWNRDQYGLKLVSSVIASEKAGKCGALFWAANNDNHSNGCCSAFLKQDASQLTPVGVDPIQPWLK